MIPRNIGGLSHSRDTLNPLLNAEVLKERLRQIEHYKYQHGVQYARWPHYALTRLGSHLYKYKANYALKGFAAYLLYRDVQNYRYWNEKVILTYQNYGQIGGEMAVKAGAFAALCALL